MWVQIALFVVSLIISYALQPKPQKPKPAAFEDFDFPTADDGTPQIVVFGDVWLTDWTVLGVGNYRNVAITQKQSGLFGSKKLTTGYKYFMGLHMGFCRGLDDLVEIKVGDKTAWTGTLSSSNQSDVKIDAPELFGGDKAEGGIVGVLSICKGAANQDVLPGLAMMYGKVVREGYFTNDNAGGYYGQSGVWIPPVIEPGVVPAYRGVVTAFFDGLICSNSPYPKPWLFRVRRTVADWDGAVWYPEKASIWLSENQIKAMNPAHIIYEAQTNRVWGRGFSSSQLDLESFKIAADQLYAENFGICMAWRRKESLTEFIQQVVNNVGASIFLDRMTGLWKLVLIRDNYNLETLPSFNMSTGLLEVIEDNNASNDIAANQVIVTYRDPISNQDQTIAADNIAAINKYGVISENKTYAGIPTATLAGRIASRDMKISQSGLKRFKLVFDRRAYALQPMSVFKLNMPEQGVESIIVRAVRVEHDSLTNGQITITVLQDVFGLPQQSYIKTQPNLNQPIDYTARLPKISLVNPAENEFRFVQLSYYDLCTQFETSKSVEMNTHYMGLMIKELSPQHLYFNMWTQHKYWKAEDKNVWQIVYNDNATMGHFSLTARIVEAMPFGYEEITVALNVSLNKLAQIRIGSAALINDEILKVKNIDLVTGLVTFGRGCVDSVPAHHLADSEIWFYEDSFSAGSRGYKRLTEPLIPGVDDINVIAQTFTKYDHTPKILIDLGLQDKKWKASDDPGEVEGLLLGTISAKMYSRAYAPYPPSYVLYNGLVPNSTYMQKTLEKMSWRGRNKFSQGADLFEQAQQSVDFEQGAIVQLRLKIYLYNDVVYRTKTFGTQLSVNVLEEFILIEDAYKVETRLWVTAAIDSFSSQVATFEFYGFGVNFGNHFGGIADAK